VVNFLKSDIPAVTESHPLNGNDPVGIRDHIVGAFHGPGIDPPSLDDGDEAYGWVSQDKDVKPSRITPAAVLVPLVERPEGVTVLLTQRTAHLNSHAGQVSFPGGKTESYDENAEDTALRETEEEIGLPREHVELIGRLGTRTTGSGFHVTPVVGLIRPPVEFRPDPGEVETIFEVPLPFVLDPANHKIEIRIIEGLERQFYVMPYDNFYIWGLTARLLVALRNTLRTP
jgi:8-oxo-dGTP pyrophosphatase MutT (NUDIX family)